MDDNCVAKLIISALLGEEVEELEFRPIEVRAGVKSETLTVLRLDFSAVIRTPDGDREDGGDRDPEGGISNRYHAVPKVSGANMRIR